MLPIILKLHVTTTAMAGWAAAMSPMPAPMMDLALAVETDAASPVQIALYDENDHQTGEVAIWRDGSTDDETQAELKRLFRCRQTHREKLLAQQTLAMLADVAEHWGHKTIEYVSVYRVGAGESPTSPHRDGRAIDFRIRGVNLRDIRDYIWRTYTEVGVGWYPSEQFLHMDTRRGLHDTAWTFLAGVNHYHPYWAELARQPVVAQVARDHGPKS